MPHAQLSVDQLFTHAIGLPAGEERSAYLNSACGSNSELKQRVERLLQAHSDAESFLESPALDHTPTLVPAPRERPGTQIGPYKLLQVIGEGGMGVVYMAEQTEPVKRKVALKLIKPGMDSRQVIARFEAERQALSSMDHVNIARVLDAGTVGLSIDDFRFPIEGMPPGQSAIENQKSKIENAGRPYFVMELIHGVTITKYCDDNHLTPRERLELFVPVCQAIQHAHQKGIIHRDIKPSNVMITLYDGKPVPKVIDFGVAKATEQKLTERTLFTQYSTMVGTLEYMSPEQAEMSAIGVDTRSDIYSLGVLLYELLTGSTPLIRERVRGAAYAEVLRRIKEEEPPRPSTRLSESGESLASISAQRQMEPAQLMRGELDWIVMKTLEKDRNRRYETANGFSADIQRYLNDEPVQACPPTAGYRMQKFVRRNRAALSVGVLLTLSLLVMVAGITAAVGWAVRDRAARNEQGAREFAERQAEVSGHLTRLLDEVTQLTQAEKWSEALVSARRAEPLLVGNEATADIRERVHKALDELEFVQQLDDIRDEAGTVWGDPAFQQLAVADPKYAKAFREFGIDLDALPLEAAVDRIKSQRNILPPVITAIDDWAAVRNLSLGGSEARQLVAVINVVDPDPWRQSLRSALAIKDWAAVHLLVKSPEFDRQPAAMLCAVGAAMHGTGEIPLKIDVLRRAQWVYPGDFWINHRLGVSLTLTGAPESVNEGIGYLQAAVALRPESSHAMMNLGTGHAFLKQHDEAEACFRKAIELHPKSASAHSSLGLHLLKQGKLDEALACHRKAIELDPKFAPAHSSLGVALLEQGKPDEAIACFRTTIELDPKFAEANSNLGRAHSSLGTALMEQGKPDEGIACFRTAIEIAPKSASAHSNLGVALMEHATPDEAIACFRTAIEVDPKYAPARSHLGAALMKQGKPDEAIVCYRKVIELDPKSAEIHNSLAWLLAMGPEDKFRDPAGAVELARKAIELDPQQGGYWNTLGVARYRVGDWKESIYALKQSHELMKGESFSFNAFFLAMAHWQLDEKDEARKWYKQPVDWMEKNQAQDEELVRFRAEAAELLGIADDVLPAAQPAVK